jgi:hypothetical protein
MHLPGATAAPTLPSPGTPESNPKQQQQRTKIMSSNEDRQWWESLQDQWENPQRDPAQEWKEPPTGFITAPNYAPTEPPGHRAPKPRRPRRGRNIALIALGAILGLFIVAGIIGAATGGKKTTADHHPAAAATPSATPSPPAAPATPSVQSQLQTWYSDGAESSINAIVSALQSIQTDADAGNFAATASDCAQLGSAVTSLQSAGPMPYAPAEKWLARGLALYSESAAECQAGASSENAAQISQATAEENQADTDLTNATNAIKNLDG